MTKNGHVLFKVRDFPAHHSRLEHPVSISVNNHLIPSLPWFSMAHFAVWPYVVICIRDFSHFGVNVSVFHTIDGFVFSALGGSVTEYSIWFATCLY